MFRRLLCYNNPKLSDKDIPKKTCIGTAIDEKVLKLDDIDKELIAVSIFVAYFYSEI